MAADLRKYHGEAQTHTDHRCDALQKRFEEKLASSTAELTMQLQKLTEANTLLQQELHDKEGELHAEIRALREQLSLELNTQVSALGNDKVSKEVLANLLQELALKLKGTDIVEEVKKAVRRKAGE